MTKLRYGAGALLLVLFGTLSVYAADPDWQVWQEKYYQLQAGKTKSADSGLMGSAGRIRVREVDVLATLPDYPHVRVSEYRGFLREKCVTCHIGIAEVSSSHPSTFGCTVCHGGDGNSLDRETAHSTLIYDPQAGTGKRNPSSLSVADKTCGQFACHAGHVQEDRNHIRRVSKSIMGTMAGVISGLRFQWAAQESPLAKFGVTSVTDEDGKTPLHWGALAKLDGLPLFLKTKDGEEHHFADHLLRQKCFQCHLDSPPPPGTYRSQGCAACHFTYSADGLYQGDDPTISRTQPGHAPLHRMTALPPNATCTQCHRAFNLNPPSASASDQPLDEKTATSFPGTGQAQQDTHFASGFDCVDCHTQADIMGDGNIYSKQHQAVEIRCETCHGDEKSFPSVAQIKSPNDSAIRLSRLYPGGKNAVGDWMAISARNRKMTNVKVIGKEIVTLGKRSGVQYKTPLIRDRQQGHQIPEHMEKLECSACHSQWVPVCTGCHTTFDQSQPIDQNASPQTAKASRFSLNIREPQLMVGPRGKVAPMLPQTARTLTVLDEQGHPVSARGEFGDALGHYRNWEFTNPHGYSGSNLAYALNPHSIRKKVRSCASCHLSPETLGMGEGRLEIEADSSGKKDKMVALLRLQTLTQSADLAGDAQVTPQGQAVAGSHQPGARPLNQEEIVRTLKVGNCIACHDRYDDPIYKNIQKSYAFERTIDHRKLRARALRSQ